MVYDHKETYVDFYALPEVVDMELVGCQDVVKTSWLASAGTLSSGDLGGLVWGWGAVWICLGEMVLKVWLGVQQHQSRRAPGACLTPTPGR